MEITGNTMEAERYVCQLLTRTETYFLYNNIQIDEFGVSLLHIPTTNRLLLTTASC